MNDYEQLILINQQECHLNEVSNVGNNPKTEENKTEDLPLSGFTAAPVLKFHGSNLNIPVLGFQKNMPLITEVITIKVINPERAATPLLAFAKPKAIEIAKINPKLAKTTFPADCIIEKILIIPTRLSWLGNCFKALATSTTNS